MSPIHAKQVLAATFEKALAARPPRLTLQSPVRYRTKGLGHWHEGIVENLSHSGILLSGPQQLTEHTPWWRWSSRCPSGFPARRTVWFSARAGSSATQKCASQNSWVWRRLFLTTKFYPQERQRLDQLPPSPLLQSGLGGNDIGELVRDCEAVEQGKRPITPTTIRT